MTSPKQSGPGFVADGPIRIVNGLDGCDLIVRDDCGLLATVPQNRSFAARSANLREFASLIAAAPDLLEALEDAYGLLGDMFGHAEAPYNPEALHVLSKISAAIARASSSIANGDGK